MVQENATNFTRSLTCTHISILLFYTNETVKRQRRRQRIIIKCNFGPHLASARFACTMIIICNYNYCIRSVTRAILYKNKISETAKTKIKIKQQKEQYYIVHYCLYVCSFSEAYNVFRCAKRRTAKNAFSCIHRKKRMR